MNTLTAETETFTAGRVQKFHLLSSWRFVVSYLQLFPVAVVMKRMPRAGWNVFHQLYYFL